MTCSSPTSRSVVATTVSGPRVQAPSFHPAFRVLARLSLMGAVSMSSGCLVEDPPPYRQPTQTRPQLDLRLAIPAQNRIIVQGQQEPISFTIPFVSEDGGDQVRAYLFLDYSEDNTLPLNSVAVPGSTLDDDSRAIRIDYPAQGGVAFGCHTIMIRVSHELNFARFPFGAPLDVTDVAEAHWWLNIIDVASGDDGSVLRNCPRIVQP